MESRLAENIKTFRKERKMTQEQLAEAIRVHGLVRSQINIKEQKLCF